MIINSDLIISGTDKKLSDLRFKGDETYSTTEQKIGIWGANRPVYRVVVHSTMPSETGVWKTLYEGNVFGVLNYGGFIDQSTIRWSINSTRPNTRIWVCSRNGAIQIATDDAGTCNTYISVWFEYIKN